MIEQVRRSVRTAIGYNSVAYRLGSQSVAFVEIARREGIGTASKLHAMARASVDGDAMLSLRSLAHPICVRQGTPDVPAIINNVIREEYGQGWARSEPRSMIDAGAYIGDTAAYFLTRFPGLKAVALEPNETNFRRAEANLSPYGDRVKLLYRALDAESGIVHISGEHDAAGIASNGQSVAAVSVPDVLDLMGWQSLDLLKMDIEGAEAAVLDHRADAWLPRVAKIILEPHGSKIEAGVRATLERAGYSVNRYRSVLYADRRARGA